MTRIGPFLISTCQVISQNVSLATQLIDRKSFSKTITLTDIVEEAGQDVVLVPLRWVGGLHRVQLRQEGTASRGLANGDRRRARQ